VDIIFTAIQSPHCFLDSESQDGWYPVAAALLMKTFWEIPKLEPVLDATRSPVDFHARLNEKDSTRVFCRNEYRFIYFMK